MKPRWVPASGQRSVCKFSRAGWFLLLVIVIFWLYLSPSVLFGEDKPPSQPTKNLEPPKLSRPPTQHSAIISNGKITLPKLSKTEPTDLEFDCPQVELSKVNSLNASHVKPATIVYSLAVSDKFYMLNKWFKRMWEPQHFYVIHIDAKSPLEFYESVYTIARDHKNVIINPDRYYTIPSGWSVLWNHISNFMHAVKIGQKRDYFINVEELSYPIKTPKEINYFLGEHIGMSFMDEDCVIDEVRQRWVDWSWVEVKIGLIVASRDPRVKPFLPIRFSHHPVILYKDVVEWMFDDSQALHVLYWLRNTKGPAEVYYSTILNASPFKSHLWNRDNFVFTTTTCCPGLERKESSPCVLGICNWNEISKTNKLFVNMVDQNIDPKLIWKIDEELDKRIQIEKDTQTVYRIPLHSSQISDPEFLDILTS